MQDRRLAALAAAALITSAGCSAGVAQNSSSADPPAGIALAASARSDLLVLRGARDARVVDSATGAITAATRSGLPTPSGTPLVGTASGRLSLIDARDGTSTVMGTSEGSLVPSVTTADGHLVALAEIPGPATRGYIAPPRVTTRIAVSGQEQGGASTTYDLQGNFEPEAFSADRSQLFLIEYLPAAAPDRYRVRQLDLATGAVNGVYGPEKSLLEEQMRGVGRMQVLDEDRAVHYTLYRTVGSDQAFVHTLHLTDQWAHCIVLPAEFGRGGRDVAIAVAPHGTLYAWDGALLATVDGDNMSIGRTASVGERRSAGSVALTVAGDGTVVAIAGREVTEFDGATLAAQRSWTLPSSASDAKTSPDGQRLYVLSGQRVLTFDRASHERLAQIPVSQGDRIAAVLAVE